LSEALDKQSPVEPMLWTMPASRQRRPKAMLVYCVPRSEWWTSPFAGRRRVIAYDNAMAESFFASLETELIDRSSWRTREERALTGYSTRHGMLPSGRGDRRLPSRLVARVRVFNLRSCRRHPYPRTAELALPRHPVEAHQRHQAGTHGLPHRYRANLSTWPGHSRGGIANSIGIV
jgi:hypothetical protein